VRSAWVLLSVGLLAGLAAQGSAQQATIKIATLVPQGSAWYTTVQEMAQKWHEVTGGRVTVRLYPGGVAGDDSDVVRKMRLGTLDGGLLTAVGFSDIDRSVFALNIPMAYASYEEYDAVLDQLAPQLEKTYADKGFVVLAWADAGWLHFFTKEPVRTPEDLKKHKLFVWAGDNPAIELWKASGFNPVPLPATEIATALQTGLVTALPTSPQAAVVMQWFTAAPYMTDVNWAVLSGGLVLSKAAWEKIPADARPAVAEAARVAALKLRNQTREGAARDLEAMAKRGLKIVEVDAAARQAWLGAAETAYPGARGPFVPAAAFDEAMRLRAAYRASKAEK